MNEKTPKLLLLFNGARICDYCVQGSHAIHSATDLMDFVHCPRSYSSLVFIFRSTNTNNNKSEITTSILLFEGEHDIGFWQPLNEKLEQHDNKYWWLLDGLF